MNSKRNYVKIARILNDERLSGGDGETINRISHELAAWFEDDNNAFDRERFLAACGTVR